MPDGDIAAHLKPAKAGASKTSPAAAAPVSRRPSADLPENVPGFSLALLGRQLGQTRERAHLLDILRGQVGRPAQQTLDEQGRRYRMAESAQEAADAHAMALEAAILTGRAMTGADAVCQILLVFGLVETLSDGDDPASKEQKMLVDQVHLALASALRVLGAEHQPLAEIGGGFYAPAICDPHPVVSVAGVEDDCSDERSLDGSIGDWS